ncbi:MAG: hypothetical protein R3F53_18330 [Gammaproteobacteria bacterium]
MVSISANQSLQAFTTFVGADTGSSVPPMKPVAYAADYLRQHLFCPVNFR